MYPTNVRIQQWDNLWMAECPKQTKKNIQKYAQQKLFNQAVSNILTRILNQQTSEYNNVWMPGH